MARRKNYTIYTGLVGSRLRPKRVARVDRRIRRAGIACVGGPFNGREARLDLSAGTHTLAFSVHGYAGHYRDGLWVQGDHHE